MLAVTAFDTLKETLQISDVLAFYGVGMGARGKYQNGAVRAVGAVSQILCPLHNDKTPSFTIYQSTNSWHCFGCGVGGSVIDFVMAYFGLDALSAAKKLDDDFGLGLFAIANHNQLSQSEIYLLKEKQVQARAQSLVFNGLTTTFETYISRVYSLLCEYLHLLRGWMAMYAPRTPEDMEHPGLINPLFVEACHSLCYIEHLTEWLCYADYAEQILFYQQHRREMIAIAKKLNHHTKSPNADKSA